MAEPNRRCRRAILLVVDALAHPVVQRHVQDGLLPNLARLLDRGGQLRPCLSIFPSITPAATCSIATGAYPARHGIEGAYWFDREKGEVAYFGDDLQMLYERGFFHYLYDFAERLNDERLQVPTVYQRCKEAGIDSACINFMWFAGSHRHRRTTPLLLKFTAGVLPHDVQGPKFLKLGDFVEGLPKELKDRPERGMFSRYGFTDKVTGKCLLAMAKADALPDLTVGYFPDNDFESHQDGPEPAARETLKAFDEWLGEFAEAVGGWDRFDNDLDLFIVGDHGQFQFSDDQPDTVQLDRCLSEFDVSDPTGGWRGSDDLLVCPNMRAAAVYLRQPEKREMRDRVVEMLRTCPGVNQVIYEADGDQMVETSAGETLRFRREPEGDFAPGEATGTVRDSYGNRWIYQGDLGSVDCRDDQGQLVEGDYPNPLERIDGSFVPGSRPIWVTGESGVEFSVRETGTHQGGSHGSLDIPDSHSALLTSPGVSLASLPNPDRPRIIDVVPLCLQALGVSAVDDVARAEVTS